MTKKVCPKIGNIITYRTPLSGDGKYKSKILDIYNNVLKVKVIEIIEPSDDPISPQKAGDIDYIIH